VEPNGPLTSRRSREFLSSIKSFSFGDNYAELVVPDYLRRPRLTVNPFDCCSRYNPSLLNLFMKRLILTGSCRSFVPGCS